MLGEDAERLVVVTSTPDGVAPLTPGERSMIAEESGNVEQTAVVQHSFPKLMPEDPARQLFEKAKKAYADSDAEATVRNARLALGLQPNYLPLRVYEELGMNISRSKNYALCATKISETVALGQSLLKGYVDPPPTERPIEPEHVNELLDIARYNLSDRYMRLGRYKEALEQLSLSEMLPKGTEAKMKRRIKEASLLYRLKEREASRLKLKEARAMDRELFLLLRERMLYDGHAGVDQAI